MARIGAEEPGFVFLGHDCEDVARALQALGPQGAEGAMLDAARWLDGAAERAEGRLEASAAAL
ncbi:hypothetical protein VB636_00305, partial [Paracoccus sp. APAP_BH8]|uniref:hypothetical protein n=1 Tax=Paracoccus sp. APAP_BH8 TaxID=3110237 RepID=UPI002FD8238D